MTMSLNGRLDEQIYPVVAAAGLLLTSTLGDTTMVSMKNYRKLTIIISIADGTAVTGSTITLKQAKTIGGSGEKPLSFSRMLANTDYGASKTMTETAVVSDTFTTQTTNSKDSLYIIEVNSEMLDAANGFDCVRLDGTGHAATNSRGVVVLYLLSGARYSGASPLVD